MAQRYVIENPGQQAELRPIASPVDTFAPPIIQAPEMKNIIDFQFDNFTAPYFKKIFTVYMFFYSAAFYT